MIILINKLFGYCTPPPPPSLIISRGFPPIRQTCLIAEIAFSYFRSMNYCMLERIESGVFQSMKNLSDL